MTNGTEMKLAASGLAALSICESLLLALSDLKVLAEKDASGVLEDAAAAHRSAGISRRAGAAFNSASADLHHEVTAIIERIIAGGNSIHR